MISADERKLVDKAFDGFHIPSKPELLTRMEQELKAEEPNMMVLADLVASDIGVSSMVLKTINSPFYGMCRTISEIKQAVMILGIEVIRALVIGVILRRAYTQKACISMERFWDNTNEIANTMVFIGSKIKENLPTQLLYTTGLFHDCALPAFAIKYNNYQKVLKAADHNETNITNIEDQQYNTNHAIMGYYIATSWGLPKSICRVILYHHDSDFLHSDACEEAKLLYSTLKVAENVVNRVHRIKNVSDWSAVEGGVLDFLHIDQEHLDDLEEQVAQMLTAV